MFPTQLISDAQSWLKSESAVGYRGKALSVKDFISELASTQGPNHLDDESSNHVAFLESMRVEDSTMLSQFMLKTAKVIAELCEWTLQRATTLSETTME